MSEARAEPVRVLTFIEVRSDSVARASALLREYVDALEEGSQPLEAQLLHEVDRPRRFVLLERAASPEVLRQGEERGEGRLQAAAALFTAPPDRRTHHPFARSCGPGTPTAAERAGHEAISVVAHLDIAGGADRAGPEAALERLAREACRNSGNERFEVWQQTNRSNHFDLVARWRSRRELDAFAASAAARAFREAVGPWLGSPYDERLYRRE